MSAFDLKRTLGRSDGGCLLAIPQVNQNALTELVSKIREYGILKRSVRVGLRCSTTCERQCLGFSSICCPLSS
jgi:hypothetical protein